MNDEILNMAGRAGGGGDGTVTTTLRLPAELMTRVDAARGDRNRADFMRACIEAGSAEEPERFRRESLRRYWLGRDLGAHISLWRAALHRAIGALTLVGDQDVARFTKSPGSWGSDEWLAVQRWLHDQLGAAETTPDEQRREITISIERP